MNINTLRKKARAHALEVEDILAAAARRTPGLQAELQRLSAELEWSHTPFPPGGSHVVPLARWAEVAGDYAEDGIAGLATWIHAQPGDGTSADYALALLQALKTPEANDALFALFSDALDNPGGHLGEAFELANTINLKFSFKGALPPTPAQSNRARSFLMALYPLASEEPQRCTVVCAMRGVGDDTTAQFLSTITPFGGPYAGRKSLRSRPFAKGCEAPLQRAHDMAGPRTGGHSESPVLRMCLRSFWNRIGALSGRGCVPADGCPADHLGQFLDCHELAQRNTGPSHHRPAHQLPTPNPSISFGGSGYGRHGAPANAAKSTGPQRWPP